MNRLLFSLILALLSFWPTLPSVQAATNETSQGDIYRGKMEILGVLRLKNPQAGVVENIPEVIFSFIESSKGKMWLLAEGQVQKHELGKFQSGDEVILTATAFDDKTLIVNAIEKEEEINPTTLKPSAITARKAVFILVNFNNAQGSAALTYDNLSKQFFTNHDSLNNFFKQSSNGQNFLSEDSDGDGKFDIVGPVSVDLNTSCDLYAISAAVEQKASQMGINLTPFQQRIFVLPDVDGAFNCGWAGVANVGCGGTCRAWVAVHDNFVYAHELGHNFGFQHAAAAGGEYNDTSCIMGAPWEMINYNAPHMDQNQWFPEAGMIKVVTQSGNYKIKAYTSHYEETGTPGMIKIAKPSTKENYYLSYRQPIGLDAAKLDSQYTLGVSLHTFADQMTGLTYLQGVLKPNESFIDSDNNITIKTLSVDPVNEEALVHIDLASNPETCTTPPATNLVLNANSMSIKTTATYQLTLTNLNPASCQNEFVLSALFPRGIQSTYAPTGKILLNGGASSSIKVLLKRGNQAKRGKFNVTFKINSTAKLTSPLWVK